MISVKYALIIAVAAFAAGTFVASPVPQAIAAVIATDVQCTGCVGTSDLAGNAVIAAKIKDGEVKAPEIAPNSVGGSELIGVTKLLFGQCKPTAGVASTLVAAGQLLVVTCNVSGGVDTDDSALASLNDGNDCFGTHKADTVGSQVDVFLINHCTSTEQLGSDATIAVIVYDK